MLIGAAFTLLSGIVIGWVLRDVWAVRGIRRRATASQVRPVSERGLVDVSTAEIGCGAAPLGRSLRLVHSDNKYIEAVKGPHVMGRHSNRTAHQSGRNRVTVAAVRAKAVGAARTSSAIVLNSSPAEVVSAVPMTKWIVPGTGSDVTRTRFGRDIDTLNATGEGMSRDESSPE
ncbi:hypothetical protein AWN90_09130 [Nocardia terpenica]|uniref:Uncharacterized protein n=2 Tax=Nocardia terpenica TaxID=455432 RepID=A0A164H093_9NOCA|nr:hypothetical protein AWN90_09130 [Nocardia terpenica]